MSKQVKIIISETVSKNGKFYSISAIRETLPIGSKEKYRITINAPQHGFATHFLTSKKFNTITECTNHAFITIAKFLTA